MTWRTHHSKSEKYASQAEIAFRRGDHASAFELYRLAAAEETLALSSLDRSKKRTLGVTAVSAASLWFKGKDIQRAEHIAREWVASNLLPTFATEQLYTILESIRNKKVFRKTAIESVGDRKNSYIISSTGDTCLTIQKSFSAPLTRYYQKLVDLDQKGKLEFDINANLDFYLRFYLPKEMMTTPGRRPERFIIMFNGLNEIFPRYFALYDRLGTSFAARKIASALLPTPFHLNRSAVRKDSIEKYKDRKDVPAEDYKIPGEQLIKNPFYLYMNFIQNLHEYRILRHLLAGEFDKICTTDQYEIDSPNAEDQDFYKRFICSETLEVSLLGYSLGGLLALSCFYDNTDSVKSCVLLNSGATIDKMTLKGIMDDREWKETVTKLKHDENMSENPLIEQNLRYDPLYRQIRTVFFSDDLFSSDIEEAGKKLILIIGGKDKIIPPESIKRLEPEGYGLNIVQISELAHFLVGDVVFDRWYPRLIRILLDFFQEPEGAALSKREAIRILMVYHAVCDCNLFNLDDDQPPRSFLEMHNILINKVEQDLNYDSETVFLILQGFEEAHRIVSAYVDSPVDLHDQLKRIRTKAGLRFGDVLFSRCPWLKDQKRRIEAYLINKPTEQEARRVLLDNQVINQQQLDFVLDQQLNQYHELIKGSRRGREWLDPIFAKATS